MAQSTVQKTSDILVLSNSSVSGFSPAASPGKAGVEALKGTILPNGTCSCPAVPGQTQADTTKRAVQPAPCNTSTNTDVRRDLS